MEQNYALFGMHLFIFTDAMLIKKIFKYFIVSPFFCFWSFWNFFWIWIITMKTLECELGAHNFIAIRWGALESKAQKFHSVLWILCNWCLRAKIWCNSISFFSVFQSNDTISHSVWFIHVHSNRIHKLLWSVDLVFLYLSVLQFSNKILNESKYFSLNYCFDQFFIRFIVSILVWPAIFFTGTAYASDYSNEFR